MNTSNRTTPDCISRLLDEASHAKVGDAIRSDRVVVYDNNDPDSAMPAYGNEICVRQRAINRLAAAGFVRIITQYAEFVTAMWTSAPNHDAMKIISDDDRKPRPFIVTVWQTVQRQVVVYEKSVEDASEAIHKQVANGKMSRLERSDDLHAAINIGCPFIASDGAVARMFRQNLIAIDPDGTFHDTNEKKERLM